MAYAPIALILPQYDKTTYAGWWLKSYAQGTITPLSMATDATGATTLAKAELDTEGFPVTVGNARFIPFINGDYDLWLIPTEGEADGNITANAIQVADNLNTDSGSSGTLRADLGSTANGKGASLVVFESGATVQDLGSTATDDGTNGFHLVHYPPKTGELNVTDAEYWYGTVERYGAAGDTTDGTDGTDDLTAFTSASDAVRLVADITEVTFLHQKYRLSGAWKIPSEITIRGKGMGVTHIYQVAADEPVIASRNWFAAIGGSVTGHVILEDFQVWGHATAEDNTKTSQHGIVLRDYYSRIENVRARYCGADGIRIDAKNDAGTAISGTLVENKVLGCDAYFNGGIGVHIGNVTTATVTDGVAERINVLIGDGGGGFVQENAAGWNIKDIHTYNAAVEAPITIQNAYYANISNLYVERFITTAVAISLQKGVNIDNVNIRIASTGSPTAGAGDTCLSIVKTGAVSTAEVNISNINIEAELNQTLYAVSALSGDTTLNISNLNIFGAFASSITPYNLSATNTPVKYAGVLDKSSNEISLGGLNGARLGHAVTSGLLSGNGAQSVNLDIGMLASYTKIIGTLSIFARANHDGAVDATYVGQIMVSTKLNGTDAWTINEIVLSAAAGFSAGPTIAATHNGSGLGHLDVDFTWTNSTAQGVACFDYTPAE